MRVTVGFSCPQRGFRDGCWILKLQWVRYFHRWILFWYYWCDTTRMDLMTGFGPLPVTHNVLWDFRIFQNYIAASGNTGMDFTKGVGLWQRMCRAPWSIFFHSRLPDLLLLTGLLRSCCLHTAAEDDGACLRTVFEPRQAQNGEAQRTACRSLWWGWAFFALFWFCWLDECNDSGRLNHFDRAPHSMQVGCEGKLRVTCWSRTCLYPACGTCEVAVATWWLLRCTFGL